MYHKRKKIRQTSKKHLKTIVNQNIFTNFAVVLSPLRLNKEISRRNSPCGSVFKLTIIMYAIIQIKGQQFKVETGKKLFVQHIAGSEAGQEVEIEDVLLVDKEGTITIGTPTVEGAKVIAEVKTPLVKGDKVIVFHKKRRKDYQQKNGHRQQFSEITIEEIIA